MKQEEVTRQMTQARLAAERAANMAEVDRRAREFNARLEAQRAQQGK